MTVNEIVDLVMTCVVAVLAIGLFIITVIFVFDFRSSSDSADSEDDSTTFVLNNCVCELSELESRIEGLELEIENIKSDKTEVED